VFAEEEADLLLAESSASGQVPGPRDLEEMVVRRVEGEPLEQVLGWAAFGGLRLVVAPGVFVPRRRTEALAELGSELARTAAHADRHPVERPVVVDLCCGVGAVAAVIAAAVPGVEVHAVDIDPAAVACARRNLPTAQVHEGDLYDALPGELRGRVDVLVANAPYVPTDEIALMPPEARLHEHRVALDGGADGLDLHRRIAGGAPEWLAPGGAMLIETSRAQCRRTAEACGDAGLVADIRRDDRVGATIVVASRPPGPVSRFGALG
jgi:release factor glutamine methyltransferase